MNWIENVTGGINTLGQDIESIKTRLDHVEESIAQLEGERPADSPRDEQPADAPQDEQPSPVEEEPDRPASLQETKEAARRAVSEPDPAPAPDESQARTPVEMVEAVLSNLTLCIEGENIPEIVRHAKQAQRWALILKREIAAAKKGR